jgi:hypothetical protein
MPPSGGAGGPVISGNPRSQIDLARALQSALALPNLRALAEKVPRCEVRDSCDEVVILMLGFVCMFDIASIRIDIDDSGEVDPTE